MICRNPDCQRETNTGYYGNLDRGPRFKEPLCPECWERYVRQRARDAVHGCVAAESRNGRVMRKVNRGNG